jgi:hypothetical protein
MDADSFTKWLFSDAGAGWIFGLVSLIVLIISALRRKAIQRVIFQELSRRSLVLISEQIRNKINISFDNQPVENLSQLQANVINGGLDIIKEPTLKIYVPGAKKFLDVSIEGEFGSQSATFIVNDKNVEIKLPFINPVKQHSHRIIISLLMDGDMEGLQVRGNGEGWSIQHEMLGRRLKRHLKASLALYWLVCLVYIAYGFIFVPRTFGISVTEWSWRALVVTSPFLLTFALLLVWTIRLARRISAVTKRLQE